MNFFSWLFRPKKYKNVLEYYPDAVLIVSESGELLYANENLLKLFNISSDELFSLELLDLFDGGFNLIDNLAKSEDSAIVKSKFNTDEELILEIRASEYEDSEQKIIITFRNVTNNQKMLNKLLFEHEYLNKITKNRNKFLAKISNEITSPIHSINGFSQAILEGLGGDVLEYTKLESGMYDYEFKNFDFVTLITNLFNQYKEKADEKKLIINFNLNSLTKRTFYSDENVLKRIIETLLENALERTETGSIQLTVSHPDNNFLEYAGIVNSTNLQENPYVMIQITDTGKSISEEDLSNIFDPYANIDKYIAKKTINKGLEMGIIYNLTRILKGRIWAESNEEKGCSFAFVIPTEKINL